MAKLLQTSITGSLTVSGSHIELPEVSGSQVVGGDGLAGQVFFDASDFKLKLKQVGVYGSFQNGTYSQFGAWSSGPDMITARLLGGSAAKGTQNSFYAAGGYTPADVSCTEEYNGVSWSAGGALSTARYSAGSAGTQNAGLLFAGYRAGAATNVITEEYNGSSWSSGGNLNNTRRMTAGAGYQNAAIAAGGNNPGLPVTTLSCTEEYNGSTWSTGGALNTGTRHHGASGTQNTGLVFGGSTPAIISCTEAYDGTSWSKVNSLITAVRVNAGAGSQDAALSVGGLTPAGASSSAQEWSGLTWSLGCNMSVGRHYLFSGGTQNAGIVTGGCAGAPAGTLSATTELYTRSLIGQDFTHVVTPASCAWSAASPLITARREASSVGSTSAGLTFSGAGFTCTEEYNGTSWTSSGAVITPRVGEAPSGLGVQNAALGFGGYAGSPHLNNTELYNGSTWSAGNTLIVARSSGMGFGLQDAGVAAGGYGPSSPANTRITCTEEFNGTSW